MSFLRTLLGGVAAIVLSVGLVGVPALAAGSAQTFTGRISDTMCGAKHHEGIPPADCVRACVSSTGCLHQDAYMTGMIAR
jgi:hypothetical protein